MKKEIIYRGPEDAPAVLLQLVDEEDEKGLSEEWEALPGLTPRRDFCLAALRVEDWFSELTPWEAPPVFGKQAFGSGAEATLKTLTEEVLPSLGEGRTLYLGGYSLAGLFALWAGYQTGRFAGIAAASPSVWYPGWREYMQEKQFLPGLAYLSLGDKEERAKNPVMARVGEMIRFQEERLLAGGVHTALEWNPGGHFQQAPLRMAKGFAWVLDVG